MKFRILRTDTGKFTAQMRERFLFIPHWIDIFCGPVSDMPREFDSIIEIETEIRRRYRQISESAPKIVHEFYA